MKSIFILFLLVSGLAMAAPHEGHHGGMISTELLLTQIYNFTLLFGLLFMILRRPIPKALAAKRAEFLSSKEKSQSELHEAKEGLRSISDRVSRLEKNFAADVARAKADADAYVQNQKKEANEISERLLSDTKKNLEFERLKYLEMLKIELLEKSTNKARENLVTTLKSADQQRLQSESFERFQEVRP